MLGKLFQRVQKMKYVAIESRWNVWFCEIALNLLGRLSVYLDVQIELNIKHYFCWYAEKKEVNEKCGRMLWKEMEKTTKNIYSQCRWFIIVLTEFQSYPFYFFFTTRSTIFEQLREGILLTQQNETLGQYSVGKIKISSSKKKKTGKHGEILLYVSESFMNL